ncbi:MAG: hypothetical protein KDJ20_14805, partial [Hyphomicrobiales bacterium]|nr:hypothetical protein [Hyphomicrobiales bacterium]
AGIWAVAAIGLAVGGGLYIAATAATVIVLVILVALKPIERWLFARSLTRRFRLRAPRGALGFDDFTRRFPDCAQRITRFVVERDGDPSFDRIEIVVNGLSPDEVERMSKELHRLPEAQGFVEDDEPVV